MQDHREYSIRQEVVPLSRPIINIYTAANQTLLIHQKTLLYNVETIHHINLQEQVIWQFFIEAKSSIQVIEDKYIAICHPNNRDLQIYCLDNKQVIRIKRQRERVSSIEVFFFKKTHMFCLFEATNFNGNQIITFKYYSSQNITENIKPIFDGKWIKQLQEDVFWTRALDDHSRIGWSVYAPSQLIYQSSWISQHPQQQFCSIQIKHPKTKQNLYLPFLREISSNLFLLYDLKQDSIFTLSGNFDSSSIDPLMIKEKYSSRPLVGRYIGRNNQQLVFRSREDKVESFIFLNAKKLSLDNIFVVDKKKQYEIAEGLLDGNICVQYKVQLQKRVINLRLVSVFYNYSEVYLMFLQHLNADFEDDLFFDCINLLQ